MSKSTLSSFLALIFCGLLIFYSYLEMTALQSATYASSALAISKFTIVLLALYVAFIRGGYRYSSIMSRFWYVWMAWLAMEFLIFFNSGGGISCLHSFFAPSCFLFGFYLSMLNPRVEKSIVCGFIVLYLLTGAYSIYLAFYYSSTYWDTGKMVSNLVFWPLCAFVFVPLVKKPLFQYLLLIPMTIVALLTAKRSAMIIIALEFVVFLYCLLKRNKKKTKGYIVLFIIIAVAAVYFISLYFSDFTDSTFARFETIQEDQGSGRVGVYESALTKIQFFTFGDILVGRGYGSIKEIGNSTGHNDAIQIFYEYGSLGLMLYIIWLFILVRRLRTVKRYAQSYYIGYWFNVITIIVLGLVSNLIPFNSYFAFLCTYLGMTEAEIFKNKRSQETTQYFHTQMMSVSV